MSLRFVYIVIPLAYFSLSIFLNKQKSIFINV